VLLCWPHCLILNSYSMYLVMKHMSFVGFIAWAGPESSLNTTGRRLVRLAYLLSDDIVPILVVVPDFEFSVASRCVRGRSRLLPVRVAVRGDVSKPLASRYPFEHAIDFL
jgi:hypothetical protein